MTDIFTPKYAAMELGERLRSSPSLHERLMAARVLGRYDFGGHLIHQALLEGLKDPEELVRLEVFRGLSRMRADRWELPELAREIRKALELEKESSPAWFAGMKALDKLRDYYEEYLMNLKNTCCPG